jgi:hypothetical protein
MQKTHTKIQFYVILETELIYTIEAAEHDNNKACFYYKVHLSVDYGYRSVVTVNKMGTSK